MKIRISTTLPIGAETAWRIVKRTATLRWIAWGYSGSGEASGGRSSGLWGSDSQPDSGCFISCHSGFTDWKYPPWMRMPE